MQVKYIELKKVVTETLKEMGRFKPECVELLCMIAAHESGLGKYRKQIKGPALSLFQIEPRTHDSIWDNCDSIDKLTIKLGIERSLRSLAEDDRYAVFVARCYLLMDKNPLPKTVCEMGEYAKTYWNSNDGKASPEAYIDAYIKWREIG
ncbi:MAG: putative endolysin [Caudoviricetes sp.]|nr:MAG: putative endolysin [Caudoviricetes sp.]